jgi:hypothetical protein
MYGFRAADPRPPFENRSARERTIAMDEQATSPTLAASSATFAKSMAALTDLLTELVDRMEADAAATGCVTQESASDLRKLRMRAERLFSFTP